MDSSAWRADFTIQGGEGAGANSSKTQSLTFKNFRAKGGDKLKSHSVQGRKSKGQIERQEKSTQECNKGVILFLWRAIVQEEVALAAFCFTIEPGTEENFVLGSTGRLLNCLS